MDAGRVLAFRLARVGLAGPEPTSLLGAAACPTSDVAADAALLALAARRGEVTREAYDRAIDRGELVVAHSLRGPIHALAPDDVALYGRALIATGDEELGAQLGRRVQRLAAEKGFAPTAALREVASAMEDALAGGRALAKDDLHEELRRRVDADLMPWCPGCGSHHVAPMLWRYAAVAAGARLDSRRRHVLGTPGRAPPAAEAVRRFLRFYAPGTAGDFSEWAGVAKPHARRLWAEIEAELTPVSVGNRPAWLLSEDVDALAAPPEAAGVRLIPPGDPYLQKPNRPLLAPGRELRTRLFRPVASPGAVLKDGALVGVWRVRAKGRRAEITVEKLRRFARKDLEPESRRIADLRGASEAVLIVD